MVFVAILIPVAIQGLTIANRAGVIADREKTAAQLADSLLSEMVVTDQWRNRAQEGNFGNQWPGYQWRIAQTSWEKDAMILLSVEVRFTVQGRDYAVRLSTLVEETDNNGSTQNSSSQTSNS